MKGEDGLLCTFCPYFLIGIVVDLQCCVNQLFSSDSVFSYYIFLDIYIHINLLLFKIQYGFVLYSQPLLNFIYFIYITVFMLIPNS